MCYMQWLSLSNNKISDVGMTAFADAVGKGALPTCTFIGLNGNPASDEAQQAVKDAIKNRST